MMIRATTEKTGHCTRCREDVRTVRPWPHWRKVRYGYFGVLGCALLGAPVVLADGFILIPTLMLFMVAIGPLNSLIAKPITCAQCGGPVDGLRRLRVIPGEANGGILPRMFRKRSSDVPPTKGKLVPLRKQNVGDGNRRAEGNENEAAPNQALSALDHE
ncbi:MAG TPA: hypothetical protein VFG30_14875 [Polyangiales bacterium]|nr:hypothetical protein [Polyangiales bacterium]